MTSVQALWAGPGLHPHQPVGLLPAVAPTVGSAGRRVDRQAVAGLLTRLAARDRPVALPA